MRIAVLADIHGNIDALREVEKQIKQVSIDWVIVLGDCAGYYYHLEDVLDVLSTMKCTIIKGNHENILETFYHDIIDDTERERLRKKYGSSYDLSVQHMPGDRIEQLLNHEPVVYETFQGKTILACHGSPWDIDYYMYPDCDKGVFERCGEYKATIILCGHTHYSFCNVRDETVILNPGSVGQSREMGGVAYWAIVDLDNGSYQFMHTRYPVENILKEVRALDPDIPYLVEVLLR